MLPVLLNYDCLAIFAALVEYRTILYLSGEPDSYLIRYFNRLQNNFNVFSFNVDFNGRTHTVCSLTKSSTIYSLNGRLLILRFC